MQNNVYVCPYSNESLVVGDTYYYNAEGRQYPMVDGIPDFTYPDVLAAVQKEQHEYYEANADQYDDVQGLTFELHGENEKLVRQKMVDNLKLKQTDKVLELACGTGRDSENIVAQLGAEGCLYVQDLSRAMLLQCQKRLQGSIVPIEYSVGNASYLAFPNNYFDAVFSFGGLNVFEDIARSLREMVRVVKPGGRVVVGDESMPPWLYETEFGKILLNGNPLFKFKLPLESIPVEARDVQVQWVIGGVYYLISFAVASGEPHGNFDLEIPGKRGGTLQTRYYGQLEGVTAETKQMVETLAQQEGLSIHQWLEKTLRKAGPKVTNDV